MLNFPKVEKFSALLNSVKTVKKIAATMLATGMLAMSTPAVSAEIPTTTHDSPIVFVQHSLDSNYIDSYHYSHSSHSSHYSHRSHMSHYSGR